MVFRGLPRAYWEFFFLKKQGGGGRAVPKTAAAPCSRWLLLLVLAAAAVGAGVHARRTSLSVVHALLPGPSSLSPHHCARAGAAPSVRAQHSVPGPAQTILARGLPVAGNDMGKRRRGGAGMDDSMPAGPASEGGAAENRVPINNPGIEDELERVDVRIKVRPGRSSLDIRVRASACVRARAHTHTHMPMHMHTCASVCLQVEDLEIHTVMCVCVCVCVCVCLYVCMYVCTYASYVCM